MPATLTDQLDRHITLGLPALAAISADEYRDRASAAIAAAATAEPAPLEEPGPGTSRAAQLLVVTRRLVPDEARVPLLRLPDSERPGVLDRNHASDARTGLAPYEPLPELGIGDVDFYVLTDVDRGDEFRGVAPRDAVSAIADRGRTPLTIDEGLSLLAAYPTALAKNHCFMLAGSSRGDKRVPALWIADRAPKLGWCFSGVPHTWLGVASTGGRVGA